MLSSDEIKQMPDDELSDPERLLAIKQEILSVKDPDDRNCLFHDLIVRLLAIKRWEQVEEFARLMETWEDEQSSLLSYVATQLWKEGKTEKASLLFTEAIELIHRTEDDWRLWQRAESLLKIARYYIDVGDQNAAMTLLLESAEIAQQGEKHSLETNDLQAAMDSSSVAREIAETIATIGEIEKAMQIAQKIINDSRRKAAITKIQELGSERRNAG